MTQEHGSGFSRWQHRLRLDASLELLVQALNGLCGACAFPVAGRQCGESEEAIASFFARPQNPASIVGISFERVIVLISGEQVHFQVKNYRFTWLA
jgi:hypothetical protein